MNMCSSSPNHYSGRHPYANGGFRVNADRSALKLVASLVLNFLLATEKTANPARKPIADWILEAVK